jgi:hypothetical protein
MLCNPSGKRNSERSREIKMKKWMMKVLLYAVFSIILLSQAVTADDESAAEEFIKSNLDAVFSVLQKKDLSQQAKNSEVEEIVTPMFDFKLMGKLSKDHLRISGGGQEKGSYTHPSDIKRQENIHVIQALFSR